VTFEIGENIIHDEGVSGRQFQGKLVAVILRVVEGRCSGEETVKDSVRWIVHGFEVGHAAIMVDTQAFHMTRGATDSIEHGAASGSCKVPHRMAGLEVVQQIEL
jgi:hypothetical protein